MSLTVPNRGRSYDAAVMAELDSIEVAAREYDARGWVGGGHMVAAMSIMRAQDVIRTRYAEALKEWKLTFPRYEALLLLYFSENGSLPLSKTTTALRVHPTNTTYTVDALEKQGLVVREPHPTDRRTTMATITPEGRRVAEESTKRVIEMGHGLEGVTETGIKNIVRALSSLREPD